MSLFHEIIAKDNIIQAYLELNTNLYNKLKAKKYRGLDGVKLQDLNIKAEELITSCQQELQDNQELSPVNCAYIPKKNGKLRDIYIYNLKDRLKAQAIFRVLEPIFEKIYSPFLFSYRSSHPSYYAARSVARRYQRYYQEDQVGVIDVSNYFYDIDHDLLIEKLEKLNLDKQTLELLISFIKIKIYKDRKLYRNTIGTPAGLPLSILFGNLYLNELDFNIGKRVALYRRVGDDLIMFDKDKEKLQQVFQDAQKQITQLKLKSHPIKSRIIPAHESFNFLGYNFNQGIISLPRKYEEKLIDKWSKEFLNNPPKNWRHKTKALKEKIYSPEKLDNFNKRLLQIISQKILVNNQQQLKTINQKLLKIITKYFFHKYSPQKQRALNKIINQWQLPSIAQYYVNLQNGKNTIKKLALSTGQTKQSSSGVKIRKKQN